MSRIRSIFIVDKSISTLPAACLHGKMFYWHVLIHQSPLHCTNFIVYHHKRNKNRIWAAFTISGVIKPVCGCGSRFQNLVLLIHDKDLEQLCVTCNDMFAFRSVELSYTFRLSDSVAPEVQTISRGSANLRLAHVHIQLFLLLASLGTRCSITKGTVES